MKWLMQRSSYCVFNAEHVLQDARFQDSAVSITLEKLLEWFSLD